MPVCKWGGGDFPGKFLPGEGEEIPVTPASELF